MKRTVIKILLVAATFQFSIGAQASPIQNLKCSFVGPSGAIPFQITDGEEGMNGQLISEDDSRVIIALKSVGLEGIRIRVPRGGFGADIETTTTDGLTTLARYGDHSNIILIEFTKQQNGAHLGCQIKRMSNQELAH
jgi:hypothetical protein